MTAMNPLEGDVNIAEVAAALGGALGVGGVGGVLVDGWFRRRRTRVDVLEKVEGIVTRAAENALARVDELEHQLAEHQRSDTEYRQRQRIAHAEHATWDNQLRDTLRTKGIDVPPPPPLEVV
ncbi:hypothetical protein [Nocardia otitidiscaviarum]|uniref:hypothetical protein n=1 Tax=Nocardia otitidiscaviarum TaxID=1823 RepID=UPI0004A70DA0|nr:hypothetical protein [Nocardia otitidiscaviarum]